MGRRTRPLDTNEYRSVDVQVSMEVELLQEEGDYCLKWPGAPLTKLIRKERPPAVDLPPIYDADEQLSVTPPATTTSKLPSVTFTLSATQRRLLEHEAYGGGRMQEDVLLACERTVLDLERLCMEKHKRTPVRMQRVIELVSAVGSTGQSKLERDVHRFWCAERLRTSSHNRPWGVPFVAAYFEACEDDDFFISSKSKRRADGPSWNDTGKTGEVRGSAAWHLPVEQPRGVARFPSTELEAKAFLDATGGVVNAKLREVSWEAGDVLSEIEDCKKWFTPFLDTALSCEV